MKWRHTSRSANTTGKVLNSHENSDVNDDEHFTSSDEDASSDIDVVDCN
jgi:hypothetical protein